MGGGGFNCQLNCGSKLHVEVENKTSLDLMQIRNVLRPASFQSLQLAEPCHIVCPERGANLSHLCWPGHNESITHVWFYGKVFISTYLSFREAKPRVWECRCFYWGFWSCAEGTASEESVIELAIEGSIEGGSITQQERTQWDSPGFIPANSLATRRN